MIDPSPALRWACYMRDRFELHHAALLLVYPDDRRGREIARTVAARWAESSAFSAHTVEASIAPLAALRRAMARDRAHENDERPRAVARFYQKVRSGGIT